MRNTFKCFMLLTFLLTGIWVGALYAADDLPVIIPTITEMPYNYLPRTADGSSVIKLNNITGGDTKGLTIDLGDTSIWGNIYISQYPFEAGKSSYDYADFIEVFGSITKGTGVLPIAMLYLPVYDANKWLKGGSSSTATPTVEYRLELFKSGAGRIGMYGSYVSFEKASDGTFKKLPTIIDGPYATLISSDDPTSVTIVWETDELCTGEVVLASVSYTESGGATTKHSVKVSGLTANTEYNYFVRSAASDTRKVSSNTYKVRTAPAKGQGPVVFAYTSDSRSATLKAGDQAGERDYMGVNLYVLKQLVADISRKKSNFIIFGGDLIWGYTTYDDDFIMQMKGWKQGMAPFWRSNPVYAAPGNHENGLKFYADYTMLDKWPYAASSGEALFATELFNPTNGPVPSDPRRPTYNKNVFSFQYGPVLVISFNNTYWYTSNFSAYGGSPTGYIMEDQLSWIENTIANAEKDSTVKFIFLYTHSPIFPVMKHVGAAMWYNGNNNVRAYTKNKDTGLLEPEKLGMIEVRNRFWKAVSGSYKSVAVFTGDEHAYHRTLIDNQTSVGVFPDDDTNGDGKLEKYSHNPDFKYPVWHITCGTAGAPYVANVESVPWKPVTVTSEYGYVLISADGNKANLKFIANRTGEVLDEFDVVKY